MKKLFFLFLCLVPYLAEAQLHNKYLYTSSSAVDSTNVGKLEFDENGLVGISSVFYSAVSPNDWHINVGNSSVCTPGGEPLFISNAAVITTLQGDTLINGDSLSFTNSGLLDWSIAYGGFGFETIFIPPLVSGGSYWLYIGNAENTPGINSLQRTACLVEIAADTLEPRNSEVISRGNEIFRGEALANTDSEFLCSMIAVKHGNGRDWWLMTNYSETGKVGNALLTPEGVVDTFYQFILENDGTYTTNYWGADFVFSPDGSKVVLKCKILDADHYANYLFDFDRCSGLFSNPRPLPFFQAAGFVVYRSGYVFSSNNRFLYGGKIDSLWQYDTWSDNMLEDAILVGTYDGYIFPDSIFSNDNPITDINNCGFGKGFNAPLGDKIYYVANTWFMHTINHPNELGLACDVDFRSINVHDSTESKVNSIYSDFNNIIGYQLYDWPGSICDTLDIDNWYGSTTNTAAILLKNEIKVFPNPLQGNDLVVDFPSTGPEKAAFEVRDISGKLVFDAIIYKGEQHLTLPNLPNGIYIYQFLEGKQALSWGKLVVVQ